MTIETRVRSTGNQAGGGGGGSADSGGLAGTGLFYVVYSGAVQLSAERILTAGSSITLTTDATAIYVTALSGGVNWTRHFVVMGG